MSIFRLKYWPAYGVLFALAALASNIPLFILNRLWCSEDLNAYFRWSEQFVIGFSEGMWRPRWESYSWEGLGAKAYGNNLFFYVVTLWSYVVDEVWDAFRLAIWLINALTGLVVFVGLRRWVSGGWALMGAVLVQWSPFAFHLVSHHNLMPFYSTMLPVCGLFFATIKPGASWIRPGVAFWLAVLVLAHPLTAFMVLICFPFYFLPVVFQGGRGLRRRTAASGHLAAEPPTWQGSASPHSGKRPLGGGAADVAGFRGAALLSSLVLRPWSLVSSIVARNRLRAGGSAEAGRRSRQPQEGTREDDRKMFSSAMGWVVSALLGLGLAAWHLYPILAGMQETVTGDWFEPVYLDWRNSFIVPVVTARLFGLRWFSVQWVLGGLAVGCALYAVLVAWLGRQDVERRWLWWGMAALLVAGCFWGMEWSYPFWAVSGHLRYVQFPYRFLQIVLTLSPIVIVLSVGCREERVGCRVSGVGESVWRRFSFFVFRSSTSEFVVEDCPRNESPVTSLQSPVFFIGGMLLLSGPLLSAVLQFKIMDVATEPDWEAIPVHYYGRLFEKEQEVVWREYVAAGYLEGEARRLGMRVETKLDHIHERVWMVEHRQDACAGAESRTVLCAVPENVQDSVREHDITLLRLPVFYHAGWRVEIDGEPVETMRDAESALLAVSLPPPDRSEVRMYWGVTSEERVGYWVSGMALMVLVGALVGGSQKSEVGGRRSEVGGWES